MATANKLYFVPLSSADYSSGLFPGLDTADLGSIGKSIKVVGPHYRIVVNDSSATDDAVLDDNFHFDEQTLAEPWGPYSAGAGVEVNYSYELSGDDGSALVIYSIAMNNNTSVIGATAEDITGFVSTAPLKPGVTYTVTAHHDNANPGYSSLVTCFAAGTQIETPHGPRSVENLVPGDDVLTLDNGVQRVLWCGSRHLGTAELRYRPHLKPIRLRAGVLGAGKPHQDLIVSPQHRVLIRSRILLRMRGQAEGLLAAKHLLAHPGVTVADDLRAVCYHHLLLAGHQIVTSNGAETESLLLGRQAFDALGVAARREIRSLTLLQGNPSASAVACRSVLPGRVGRNLVRRHVLNNKQLVGCERQKILIN